MLLTLSLSSNWRSWTTGKWLECQSESQVTVRCRLCKLLAVLWMFSVLIVPSQIRCWKIAVCYTLLHRIMDTSPYGTVSLLDSSPTVWSEKTTMTCNVFGGTLTQLLLQLGHFAYWTLRLLVISSTAHFAYSLGSSPTGTCKVWDDGKVGKFKVWRIRCEAKVRHNL